MPAHVKRQRTVENTLPSQMLALEPRYLFDAAVVTTVADVASDPATPTTSDTTQESAEAFVSTIGLAAVPDQTINAIENTPAGITIGTINDPTGDTFTLLDSSTSDTTSDTAFTIDLNTGDVIVANPQELNYEDPGLVDHSFTLVVNVTHTEAADTELTITVQLFDLNETPTIEQPEDQTVAGDGITTLELQIVADDPDAGEVLTYTLINAPDGTPPPDGASIDENGLFSWTPTPDQIGDTVINVKVSDDAFTPLTKTAQFTVTVEPVVSISDATTVEEGNALNYTVSLNGNTEVAVTAELGFGAGTATAGSDYETKFYSDEGLTNEITSVTLGGANSNSMELYVKTLTDGFSPEDIESVIVSVSNIQNAVPGVTSGSGGIIDVPPPPTVNDATVMLSEDSSTEPGNESGDESGDEGEEGEEGGEGEDGGEEGGDEGGPDTFGDGGPAEGDEITQQEAAEIEAEVEALVAKTDLSETAESPAAGKPDAQQPQTRAEEVAQIMSIMDKAISLASCVRLR